MTTKLFGLGDSLEICVILLVVSLNIVRLQTDQILPLLPVTFLLTLRNEYIL